MATSPTTTPTVTRQQPVQEIRLGAIKAAVWQNETENGVRFNVTFERLYRDADTWKSSDSFGRDDLLLLAKVADRAHTWILEQRTGEPRSATTPAAEDSSLAGKRFPKRAAANEGRA